MNESHQFDGLVIAGEVRWTGLLMLLCSAADPRGYFMKR
jgi:hypothetical protein